MPIRHIICLLLSVLLISCTEKIPRGTIDPRAKHSNAKELNVRHVKVTGNLDKKLLQPDNKPYMLGPGDILDIEIAEMSGTLTRTFIMPDGMIYFNLAGGVHAEGLTTSELSKKLQSALKRDYTNPVVNVSLVEVRSNRYWILGRVYNPGLYPLRQPTTLLDAVSQAGGLFSSAFSGTTEELADLTNSIVVRDGEILPVDFEKLIRSGDTSQNIYLKHNDYIYIPSATAESVLLLGEVMIPQSIGYNDGLTLIDCIAQGKGPTKNAYLKEVVIVRGSLKEASAGIVDLNAILTGKDTNVLLKPGDIIWIPKQPLGLLSSTVKLIFQSAVRTAASNEGSNFAGGGRQPLSIPLTTPTP